MSRSGSRWWLLPAIGILLSYNTWVLWAPLNGQAQILDGYLSELSAADQPHHLVFRGGDLITGVLAGLLGAGALRHWSARAGRRRRWWLLAAAGLVLFALGTAVDAVLAMDCSPALDQQCRLAEEAGTLSTAHTLHTGSSMLAQVGITVSLVAGAVASPLRLVRVLAVVEVLSLTVMMIMLAVGVPGLGYPQMIMVGTAAGWCLLVGFGLAGVLGLGGHDGER